MIIRELRLQNIKSFGDGPDGAGITIAFEPGINRIAGRNGRGKTTVLESIGYALFLTRPLFEENFDVATYLLRAGKKAGEIDITFEHDGATWRIERGLGGQSRRRAKVILLDDGSTAAEGDAEVENFLCRLFGFAEAGRLSELFAKLIGVKQGRLAWPFDSKPSEARKHFEPLLDVEIFRQCYDRLKPAMDTFETMRAEAATKLAVVAERIRERAESPAKADALALQVRELDAKTTVAKAAKDAAEARVKLHEGKEAAHREAERSREDAAAKRNLAKHRDETAAQRRREALEAGEIVTRTQPAHDAYAAIESAAKALQQTQEQRAKLREQRAERAKVEAQLAEQSAAAKRNAATLLADAEGKDREVTARRQQLEKQRTALAGDSSTNAEAEAGKRVEESTQRLAAAEQQRATFGAQLQQIAGGVCPFLKEPCRQFDAAKVQTDLARFDDTLAPLRSDLKTAKDEWERSRSAVKTFTTKRAQLEAEARAIETLAKDAAALRVKMAAELKLADERSARAVRLHEEIEQFDRAITEFGDLDAEARRLHASRDEHAPGYRAFVAAKPVADELAAREKARVEAQAALVTIGQVLENAEVALAAARKEFNAAELAAARKSLLAASDEVSARTRDLAHASATLEAEKKRVSELEKARAEQAALEQTIGRHEAASALAQKARNLLRDAAPLVAQHLCRRIAALAQQIFNRINHDPVELDWPSERYSLRIEPGARRFAMLSGGEQTKLALAMTLAMIQEFSGLKFCVFDEPTYGVDADSRSRLADAIIEAQAATHFDQLILVSHDDAFDGKIEHVVMLEKSAGGTELAAG